MPDKIRPLSPISKRPFAATLEGSNFPYHEVRDLPGYAKRDTPALGATGVTSELARYLVEYAKRKGSPLPYQEQDISFYLWRQASRRMLPWEEILRVVRATRKRDRCQPIAHYFGYLQILGKKETTRVKKRIKLVRYIAQEGECAGCGEEFQFSDLTLDRIKPGKLHGEYVLSNVQLMCQRCNNAKKANYDQEA